MPQWIRTAAALLLLATLPACHGVPSASPAPGEKRADRPAAPPETEESNAPDALEEMRERWVPLAESQRSGSSTKEEGEAPSSPAPPENGPSTAAAPDGREPTEGSAGELADREKTELLAKAEAFADDLVGQVRDGDREAAAKALLTDDELKSLLTEGGYRILAGHVLVNNRKRLEDFFASTAGREVEHAWQPGRLTQTPPMRVWRQRVPMMTNAVLTLRGDGETVRLLLQHMLYVDGEWKVFRLR